MINHIKISLSTLFVLLITFYANAQLKLPNVITSNMVLQQQQTVPVWGWTGKGAIVSVQFAGQQKSTKADENGYWKINLSSLKASAQPAQMTVTSAGQTITLNNILVGEVWLCSGQSNMEYPMKKGYSKTPPARGADSAALELSVNNPQIRLFNVKRDLSGPDVVTTGWQECKGEALEQFSALGYFFAKNMQNKLQVPVGIIFTSWGGTQIEPWTPVSTYLKMPVFKDEATKNPKLMNGVEPGKIYNSMVKPLAPYAVKGFLWYQGESNVVTEDSIRYADKMQALIESWRETWGNNKLPFYDVMLAPHYYTHRKDKLPHNPETLPLIWEAQTAALAIPNTEMVTVNDLVDNLDDIHPSYKWEIGRRMAALVLSKKYGYKNMEFTGPRFKSMQVKGDKIVLTFTHSGGLKTSDGQPANWFTIAGNDGKFVDAKAEIKGDKVIVSSPQVTEPKQVRLGWNEIAEPNLINGAGLPAVPFRTDHAKWVYQTR